MFVCFLKDARYWNIHFIKHSANFWFSTVGTFVERSCESRTTCFFAAGPIGLFVVVLFCGAWSIVSVLTNFFTLNHCRPWLWLGLLFLWQRSEARMPFKAGHEEDGFLQALGVSPDDLEPLGNNCSQVNVISLIRFYPPHTTQILQNGQAIRHNACLKNIIRFMPSTFICIFEA